MVGSDIFELMTTQTFGNWNNCLSSSGSDFKREVTRNNLKNKKTWECENECYRFMDLKLEVAKDALQELEEICLCNGTKY